jgi:hypothetical protein
MLHPEIAGIGAEPLRLREAPNVAGRLIRHGGPLKITPLLLVTRQLFQHSGHSTQDTILSIRHRERDDALQSVETTDET